MRAALSAAEVRFEVRNTPHGFGCRPAEMPTSTWAGSCHSKTRSEVRLGEKRMGRTARSSQLGISQGCPQISLRQVNSELFLQYPPIVRFVLERTPFDLT